MRKGKTGQKFTKKQDAAIKSQIAKQEDISETYKVDFFSLACHMRSELKYGLVPGESGIKRSNCKVNVRFRWDDALKRYIRLKNSLMTIHDHILNHSEQKFLKV